MSEKLQRAREFELQEIGRIPEGQKPNFHFCSPTGWINDPNGFSSFRGEYHLFFQYHPYSVQWGPMHWGHAKTKDFISWELLPCALAPDEEFDAMGCFSGSALEWEGRQYLMYTGVKEIPGPDGKPVVRQTQCMADGDGVNYEKWKCNPVIEADCLPAGSFPEDFRDPKIWKEEDGFYAVVGSRSRDTSGQIAMFRSKDMREWELVSVLDRSENRFGKMWECPDFFPLDGRQVLIASPQTMEAEGLEFHNGNGTIYLVGSYDPETHEFHRIVPEARAIDYGLDFYAPQTLLTPDGRRVMIGWMKSWDNDLTPEGFSWCGFMTITRELHLKGDKLYQLPVRELENYYGKAVETGPVVVEGGSFVYGRDPLPVPSEEKGLEIPGIRGRQFDMTVWVKAGDYRRFEIDLAADDSHKTMLYYEPGSSALTFDRTWSGGQIHDTVSSRSCYVDSRGGEIELRIVMDRYGVEVFVNGGEQAMSCLTYTDEKADRIRFGSQGRAEFEAAWRELKIE